MGKVTVKHYLNKSVKPKTEGNKELYPLYVQVIVNRTNYRFKSNCFLNDGYLNEYTLNQDYMIKTLENEKLLIEKIVAFIQEIDKSGLINADTIYKYSENLWDVLNRNFGILFENESKVLMFPFPNVLAHRNYIDIKEVLEFTESQIEQNFSEEYRNCRIGINAVFDKIYSDFSGQLGLSNLTVFDYLHGGASEKVLESIKMYHGIYGGDEEKEYLSILNEINKLIDLK